MIVKEESRSDGKAQSAVYVLKGLDCPHCAAKIEKEVGQLSGIDSSSLNLVRQTLTVTGERAASVKAKIAKIVHSHEPKVRVTEYGAKNDQNQDNKAATLIRIGVGGVLFVVAAFLHMIEAVPTLLPYLVIVAYLILGCDVIYRAARNIIRGRIFDENFLMSISTVGALIIGEHLEAVAVMLLYQVGELFQSYAVSRSRKSIVGLMSLRPDEVTVIRESEMTVLPEEVKVGELILIRPGERIPLDGIVTSGQSQLDTKALTGESMPREITSGDEVLSGCVNLGGVLTVKVIRPYGESTVNKIIDLVENASGRKARAENFITKFARYYTPVVVILAALLAVLPPLCLGGGWLDWTKRGLVFLVVSCPCALVISVPLTYFGGIGAASRRGVLVKGGNYLDALCNAKTFVFDKTGTLTKGEFCVTGTVPCGVTDEQLLVIAAKAERYSNHPISRSIVAASGVSPEGLYESDYTEIAGQGVCATVDGKKILCGNERLMRENGIEFLPCAESGTKVFVAQDGKYIGCILIADEVKADSKRAVREIVGEGKRAVMLTGDHSAIASSVAKQLSIDEFYAELLPAQKAERLEEIAASVDGGIAFVGDGINDAPVLACADVGIAMGGLGSDVAIEAADVVLMTDEPSKIVDVIKIAKKTRRIVVQNIVFALGVKAVILALGAFGIAGMWEAVFGDVGVAVIAILNALRIMKRTR